MGRNEIAFLRQKLAWARANGDKTQETDLLRRIERLLKRSEYERRRKR